MGASLLALTKSIYYSTRHSCYGNLYVTSINTSQYGFCSLKFTGSRLWNSLPPSVAESNSLGLFRKALKNYMLNCYIN